MSYDEYAIASAVLQGLRDRCAADDLEQAVYSIDARDELGLHPLIHASLRQSGFGVFPEQRYPSERLSRKKSLGKRCDVVLTPDLRPLVDPQAAATLFAPPDALPLEQAYWLEIKTVSMFTTDGPFARYSAELLQPVTADVQKLYADPLIFQAGLLLVLFTAGRQIADHDVQAWQNRCLERDLPVYQPAADGFPLNDRIGNSWCHVALFPIKR